VRLMRYLQLCSISAELCSIFAELCSMFAEFCSIFADSGAARGGEGSLLPAEDPFVRLMRYLQSCSILPTCVV